MSEKAKRCKKMQKDAKRVAQRETGIRTSVPFPYKSSFPMYKKHEIDARKKNKTMGISPKQREQEQDSTSIPRAQIGKRVRTMRSPIRHAHKVSTLLTDMSSTGMGLLLLLRSTEARAEGVHAATSDWHGDASLGWLLHLRLCLHLLLRGSHAVFGQRLQGL